MKIKIFLLLLLLLCLRLSMSAQLDCNGAITVIPGTIYNGTTVGGQTKVSTYNNDLWWQLTGPEKVHVLDWPGGVAEINLTNKGAKLDLILLNSCDANNFKSSGGGNSGTVDSKIKENLTLGKYYIVVDGWQLAAGNYTISVTRTIEETISINNVKRIFRMENGSIYEIINGNLKFITNNVVSMEKNWGYVTDINTGDGKETDVLAIMKMGETKPRIFLNENFNTEYLKQKLNCTQKNLSLFGEFVLDDDQRILSNCNVLRCENGYTLSHQRDGQIKLYQSSPNNTWLDIDQIVTINGVSYYVKSSDNSVWVLDQNASATKMIGTNAKLLQDNDNQLIKIDQQGKYARWNGQQWLDLTPNYVGVSPEMIDEGFWFFIQAKPLLDQTGNVAIDQKMGLTFDQNGLLKMELIPASGDCERFLWRTKSLASGKRLLINKAKGENMPLLMGANGSPSFTVGSGATEWIISVSDKNKYGTNAYQLFGSNASKALAYDNGVVSSSPQTGNKSQTWVFQFNQMVKDYFLPMPTKTILKTHFTANPNINVDNDADAILKDYNKFLKGDNDTYYFSTNTGSDWALVNYYFVINNILNAAVSPKPSDPNVDPNIIKPISVLAGISMILINKNDLSYSVTQHYFPLYPNDPTTAERVRGSGFYAWPKKAIFQSEELTCKTGIVNRPLDKSFRRFDHGVHEYAHALQDAALTNWDAIQDANNMCNSEKASQSSECGCYDIQYWFNSVGDWNSYPGNRARNATIGVLMEKFFKKDNTWMPPKDLRMDGYNPSGPTAPDVQLTIAIPDTIGHIGKDIVIPVYLTGGDPVGLLQMNISYDESLVTLDTIISTKMKGFKPSNYNITSGKVIIAWDDPALENFTANGILMNLYFKNNANSGKTDVTISEVTIADNTFNTYVPTLDQGSIDLMISSSSDTDLSLSFNVYPNPFIDLLNIEVGLNTPEKIRVTLTDITGRTLKTENTDKISDQHVIQVKDLEYKGVIFVKVESKNVSKTIKVIRI